MGDGGADREEFHHTWSPAVIVREDVHSHHALRLHFERVILHPLHRQLACIVERGRIIRHLDIAPNRFQRVLRRV